MTIFGRPHAAPRLLGLFSAAVWLALAAAASAQEPQTEPAAPSPPAAAPASPAAWSKICDPAPQAGTEAGCAIVQKLVTAPGGPRILQVSIRPVAAESAAPPPAAATDDPPPATGTARAVARLRLDLPLGFDIAAGVLLRIDGEVWTRAPVRTCLAEGCVAGLLLAEEDVARLKRGGRMGVLVQALDGRVLAWPVTLAGFTAAYDELVPGPQ